MPHSSGGGSHSGGSHSGGGSSYHSGGSHSGSSYSGSSISAPNLHRVSRRPYNGSHRYVYYDRHNEPHSLYQSGSKNSADLGGVFGVMLLMGIFLIPIAFFAFKIGIYVPRKLDLNSYRSEIIVEDDNNILNTEQFEDSLEKFRESTGVTPGIKVVLHSEWKENYKDLEAFAYNEYLRFYDDEKHWLVVISYPDDYKTASFVDWEWEGMIGDDCYPAFNSDSEEKFTDLVQRNLLRSDTENVASYLAKVYTEFAETGMEKQITPSAVVVGILSVLVFSGVSLCFIIDYIQAKRLSKCVMVGRNAQEYTCEYCGTRYVAGSVSTCRSCGAAIPAHNDNQQQKKDKKN